MRPCARIEVVRGPISLERAGGNFLVVASVNEYQHAAGDDQCETFNSLLFHLVCLACRDFLHTWC